MKSEMKIGKDLFHLIVDSLEGDARFRSVSHLPPSKDEPQPPLEFPKILD